VDRHLDFAAAVGVEDRVVVAMERMVRLQRLIVVFLEDRQVRDLHPALLEDEQQVGYDGLVAEFEAIDRLGLDPYKDDGFHWFDPCAAAGGSRPQAIDQPSQANAEKGLGGFSSGFAWLGLVAAASRPTG
jgi:hypothetical protein